ncbi:MAG: hypothetical protein ACOC8B_00925 [Gemmatimonadota bacterium]
MASEQKGRAWKAPAVGAAAAVVALGFGGLGIAYSGAYDVAATAPHTGLVERVLGTTMERSVRSRAASVGESIAVGSGEHSHDPAAEVHSHAPGTPPHEH